MDSAYVCTSCGAGHDNPKSITVCSACGGRETIKVRSALTACAKAHGELDCALEEDDLDAFARAQYELLSAASKLSPPSSR